MIFSGPLTEEYEATNGTLPPKSQRGGLSAGNWVGHIAIKGDNTGEDADKFYYTDGRTRRPAVRKRYLAAVYIFTECVECNLDAINKKKACDDAYLEE